jgi:Nif-specific regulatory protein
MKWNELSMDEDLLKQNVEDFEKHIIVSALLRTHGNQSLAAKQLGTTTRVIAYRVQKYNIDLEQFHDKKKH